MCCLTPLLPASPPRWGLVASLMASADWGTVVSRDTGIATAIARCWVGRLLEAQEEAPQDGEAEDIGDPAADEAAIMASSRRDASPPQ
mmetsp:Transcript_3757/g.8738  ORF Transcript_3757/g.8738 Transcript_3757/m.8738 type:complete len:88 (+) Transcript_3757:500-763(+)